MVHNEVHNLPQLLAAVQAEEHPNLRIDRIIVVSSGSTDGSNDAVQRTAATDPRIQLLTEPARTGKARAINRFLHALDSDIDRVVLLSGDVLPERGAVAHLLAGLDDPGIGMTGGRVIPTNPRRGWVHRTVHMLWMLHHQVATRQPKLGEMVAFRPSLGPIHPDSPVDEASIEAAVHERGLRLAYLPVARVFNRGPATWRELIAQRRRIWTGHNWLRDTTGYRVATYRFRDLIGPVLAVLRRRPHYLPLLLMAGTVELWARAQGALRLGVSDQLPTVWPVLPSTKGRLSVQDAQLPYFTLQP